MLFREFGSLDEQRLSLQADIHAKIRRIEEFDRKIMEKEKEIFRLEKKIEEKTFVMKEKKFEKKKATIYLITPTFFRPTQMADLTRLAQTLMQIPTLFWIFVEDSEKISEILEKKLIEWGIRYSHLAARTPPEFRLKYESYFLHVPLSQGIWGFSRI